MTTSLKAGSVIAQPGQSISLSSMFSVTAGSNNPTYLILTGLDRAEYTVTNTGQKGWLSGDYGDRITVTVQLLGISRSGIAGRLRPPFARL